jgi:hypothetical protein
MPEARGAGKIRGILALLMVVAALSTYLLAAVIGLFYFAAQARGEANRHDSNQSGYSSSAHSRTA